MYNRVTPESSVNRFSLICVDVIESALFDDAEITAIWANLKFRYNEIMQIVLYNGPIIILMLSLFVIEINGFCDRKFEWELN